MKWAHGVITSFFHAEVGSCDAERLLSHNTEVKDELQFCLLDHNQASAEEGSNVRWLLILSYLGKTSDKINDVEECCIFCVYWCTCLHIHGLDILVLLLLSYDSLYYFFCGRHLHPPLLQHCHWKALPNLKILIPLYQLPTCQRKLMCLLHIQ